MTDYAAKVEKLLAGLLKTGAGRDLVSGALERQGFRLMQHIEAVDFPTREDRLANARRGIILDVETTGFDTQLDGITQLAMLQIWFDDEGIVALGDVFDRLNDPGMPISAEVSRLTGITDDMVAGQRISEDDIRGFLGEASIVIAHNAGFDRKMVEARFPGAGFDRLDWHCSLSQVNWLERGTNGRALELIALSNNLIYGSHNAANDIRATAFALNMTDDAGKTAFCEMLADGDGGKIKVIAEGSPFESKDHLKEYGFQWSPDGLDACGYTKVWHMTVDNEPATLSDLATFLSSKVYKRDKALPCFHITPQDRYSQRIPATKTLFRTADVTGLGSALSQAKEPDPVYTRSGPLL